MAKKQELFVSAAQATGAGSRRILPNIASAIVVKMSLNIGFAILTVTALGFIAIAVKASTAE